MKPTKENEAYFNKLSISINLNNQRNLVAYHESCQLSCFRANLKPLRSSPKSRSHLRLKIYFAAQKQMFVKNQRETSAK